MSVLKRKDAGVWEVVGGGSLVRGTLPNGYAQVTTPDVTGIGTSDTDLSGLSVTVNVNSGERIRITGHAVFNKTGANGIAFLRIKEGTTLLNTDLLSLANGEWAKLSVSAVLTPSAGSHTYKLMASVSAGTLTWDVDATFPSWILVEGIGT